MSLPRAEFAGELMRDIARAVASAGTAWKRIEDGKIAAPGLQRFAEQFFLQVFEFPARSRRSIPAVWISASG